MIRAHDTHEIEVVGLEVELGVAERPEGGPGSVRTRERLDRHGIRVRTRAEQIDDEQTDTEDRLVERDDQGPELCLLASSWKQRGALPRATPEVR